MASDEGRKRQLTLLDCFGLGVNGIIGSGIFLLPAGLYRRAGGHSPLAWIGVGLLCALVALCFAEAAGRTDRSGGPYRYAADAFGPFIGFGVGWITLCSSILGYAAVARGFAEHAAPLAGGSHTARLEPGIALLLIILLGVINTIGIRPSARVGDVVGVIKVAVLVGFVAIGIFFVRWASLGAPPAPGPDEHTGLVAAGFAGLFATTGFEYVPVPAGETVNPQRTIGLVMVVSVLAATVLYALVQLVAVGTAPALGSGATPLVAAAGAFAGRTGAFIMSVGAMVSAFGFCASSALICPVYVASFAEDDFLPSPFARRSRYGTPAIAVFVTSAVVAPLAMLLDFSKLTDVSNVAVVMQYIVTCLSVIVMRRRDPVGAPRAGLHLPFGPLVPILATLGCLLFLSQVGLGELAVGGVMLVAGLVLGYVTRLWRQRRMR